MIDDAEPVLICAALLLFAAALLGCGCVRQEMPRSVADTPGWGEWEQQDGRWVRCVAGE